MQTYPDCEYVEKQVMGNPNFEVIDIGKHVRNLKQFIKLRDTNPAFDEAKAVDDLGIPWIQISSLCVYHYSRVLANAQKRTANSLRISGLSFSVEVTARFREQDNR